MCALDVVDHEKEAREENLTEGRREALIDIVCRKMAKGSSSQEIAGALEEDPAEIDRIYNAALKYAPGYDVKAIYEELNKGQTAESN